MLRADTGGMLLRFVQGRPVSQVTEDFLAWVGERLAAEGKKALLLVWDNAPWHVSRAVRSWIRAHNRRVKWSKRGVRIINTIDPELAGEYLNSPQGERVLVNLISRNAATLRNVLT